MLDIKSEQDFLQAQSADYEKMLYLDCSYNKVTLPDLNVTFGVNEAQKRLIFCLISHIVRKQEIMSVIWNDSHLRLRDNNYHQLVFQTRALLQRNGLPAELIMTVPHYGLKLNEPVLRSMMGCKEAETRVMHKNSSDMNNKIEVSDSEAVISDVKIKNENKSKKSSRIKWWTQWSFLTRLIQ